MAREAKAAGAVHWTGMGGEEELEALVATGARTYGLLYFPSRRRDFLPPAFLRTRSFREQARRNACTRKARIRDLILAAISRIIR